MTSSSEKPTISELNQKQIYNFGIIAVVFYYVNTAQQYFHVEITNNKDMVTTSLN